MSSDFGSSPIREERGLIRLRRPSSAGCMANCGVVLGCGGGLIGILIGALAILFPNVLNGVVGRLTGIPMPETAAISGPANAFDPIAALASVSAFAGDGARIISFRASSVRPDGTLDLTASYSPAPRVDYEFVREVPRPANAPPVGAGSTGRGPWFEPVSVAVYQPGQRRHFSYSGGGVSADVDYVNEGMERDRSDPTTSVPGTLAETPRCHLADLWQTAQAHDAPSDAVATIRYDADGYDFSISALGLYLTFDADCKLKTSSINQILPKTRLIA